MTVLVQDVVVAAVYVQPLTRAERREDLRALIRKLKADRPQSEIVVAGDLNNPEESPEAVSADLGLQVARLSAAAAGTHVWTGSGRWSTLD